MVTTAQRISLRNVAFLLFLLLALACLLTPSPVTIWWKCVTGQEWKFHPDRMNILSFADDPEAPASGPSDD
jgi:hypothetical protein